MAEKNYNTNLTAEFYVLSILHRLGIDATLTLGNKKSVDIVVVKGLDDLLTIDVKGIAGTSLWPTDNVKEDKIKKNHFLIFVSFLGKIKEHSIQPETYIVPSERLKPLLYRNPKGNRVGLRVATRRKDGKDFRDAWHLLTE